MAVRFNNNNNSEWMQMLFDKINNGSPFGITFIRTIPPSSLKATMGNCYKLKEPDWIRSCLINKLDFIGFVEIVIEPTSEILFFVYENEPSTTFNLKNYLLVLAKMHCNPTAICYCENKQDTQNTDTKEIKFLKTRNFFGKEFGSTKIKIEISNPETFWDSLLGLRNEFYSVTNKNLIEKNDRIFKKKLYPHNDCFVSSGYSGSDFNIETTFEKHMEDIKSHYKRFRETFLLDYSETLPSETINKLKARVIEERDQQKSEKNEAYKQSSAQNIKINEIAEDLKSGKIVGKKIINNALSYASKEYTGSGYCFIDLKDLEAQLMQYKQDLSHHIIVAYCQSKEITLTDVLIHKNHALIHKIEYNLHDNTFCFIFDVDNVDNLYQIFDNSYLIIKVPREALRDMNMKLLKIQPILKSCVREGSCITQNKTIANILTPESLEMQLLQKLSQNKTDLSNRIIEALNCQLSFQQFQPPIITYISIRKVQYNFKYNTFHFIFNIINFLDEKLEFIIEVPRETLDLENVDRLVECMLSPNNHSQGSLVYHISEGSYIIDLHLIDD
nr:hypothetical protein [Helicobacter pylori]